MHCGTAPSVHAKPPETQRELRRLQQYHLNDTISDPEDVAAGAAQLPLPWAWRVHEPLNHLKAKGEREVTVSHRTSQSATGHHRISNGV